MDLTTGFFYFLIIFIGIIFHLLYGYSMFDIFFKFPLNYGMTPHSSNLSEDELPSNRVVLLVLDGVRADTFFECISSGKSPFLRNIITKKGVYGVSHTKVPTETKPGFTAICSGHFEDASLALKDLYDEVVTLDSVFNQSKYSWGIGHNADMFTDVAKQMETIPSDTVQDFSNEFANEEDYKLFYILMKKMNDSKSDKNSELYKKLNSNKIAFLMHLVQTDSIGHSKGPKSNEIRKHLIELDSYYEKLYNFFNDFYKDNKTTFIITADHGMDLRKGHGDGQPCNTRTPFVIWGSGIREAKFRENKPEEEDTPEDWNLNNYERRDISQIDITPLTAGLLGTNFPMNSLGILPLDIFNVSEKTKSKLIYGNMMELFELYKIKDEIESRAAIYKSFNPLINSDNLMKNILTNIDYGNYTEAINKTNDIINLTLKGIDYILHYDRIYLKTIVSFGYISWMIYLLIFVKMKNEDLLNKFFFYNSDEKIVTIIIVVIIIGLYLYLFLRLSPFIYFVYTFFPCYFLWRIMANINHLKSFFFFSDDLKKILINLGFYIFTILAFLSIVSLILNNFFKIMKIHIDSYV